MYLKKLNNYLYVFEIHFWFHEIIINHRKFKPRVYLYLLIYAFYFILIEYSTSKLLNYILGSAFVVIYAVSFQEGVSFISQIWYPKLIS